MNWERCVVSDSNTQRFCWTQYIGGKDKESTFRGLLEWENSVRDGDH